MQAFMKILKVNSWSAAIMANSFQLTVLVHSFFWSFCLRRLSFHMLYRLPMQKGSNFPAYILKFVILRTRVIAVGLCLLLEKLRSLWVEPLVWTFEGIPVATFSGSWVIKLHHNWRGTRDNRNRRCASDHCPMLNASFLGNVAWSFWKGWNVAVSAIAPIDLAEA